MLKNLILDLILGDLTQIWAQKIFFMDLISTSSYIVASHHCMKFQGKLLNQTWENGKKPSFGTNFGSTQIWAPNFFFLDFTSTTG